MSLSFLSRVRPCSLDPQQPPGPLNLNLRCWDRKWELANLVGGRAGGRASERAIGVPLIELSAQIEVKTMVSRRSLPDHRPSSKGALGRPSESPADRGSAERIICAKLANRSAHLPPKEAGRSYGALARPPARRIHECARGRPPKRIDARARVPKGASQSVSSPGGAHSRRPAHTVASPLRQPRSSLIVAARGPQSQPNCEQAKHPELKLSPSGAAK